MVETVSEVAMICSRHYFVQAWERQGDFWSWRRWGRVQAGRGRAPLEDLGQEVFEINKGAL